MAVIYILEIMPMEQMLCVITPQNAPGPVTRIQISAQTMEGSVRMSRISALKMNATGLGMIFGLARKLMGRARMPPTTVPRMAMQTVSISRYGTPSVEVENRRFISGLTRPQKMPLATSVPLAAKPLKVTLEADQLSSSAMMNTMSV